MKRVYIYCEGQTEEAFINEILYPYFINLNIVVSPIVCTTKRTVSEKFKGGVVDYFKIKKELTILCRQHRNESFTTMFDYYGMAANTPNISCETQNIYERMNKIENAVNEDIGMPNLSFSLVLHEFESLLFSDPKAFSVVVDDDVVQKISKIRNDFETPEYINNSSETAPSKRLEQIIPNYPKVQNGVIVSKAIGIDCMLRECRHFAKWIDKIKNC